MEAPERWVACTGSASKLAAGLVRRVSEVWNACPVPSPSDRWDVGSGSGWDEGEQIGWQDGIMEDIETFIT